jgi:hypothetical protein
MRFAISLWNCADGGRGSECRGRVRNIADDRAPPPDAWPNRLKLGVFSATADSGLTLTSAPERWLHRKRFVGLAWTVH